MDRDIYDAKAVRRLIIFLMLPIIAENFLQVFTDLLATAMVGRLTEMDISAQGMCTKTIDLVYYLFRGTGVALVVIIAKKLTGDGLDVCRTIFEKAAVSTIVISTVMGMLLYMRPELVLQVFTDEQELILHAAKYLRILLFCLPFWGLTVCVSSAFQANGDTKTPMYIAVFVNLLNTVLCYGMIFGKFGMPELGYIGAALSLVISRVIGCVISIIMIYSRRVGIFSWKGKRTPADRVLAEVYSIGIPNAGEWAVWQVASIILSRIILSYGQSAFAAYQLGVQAEFLTEIPAIGFSVAATSMISRAIGLKDKRLFDVYKKEMLRICIAISAVTSCSLMLFPGFFMRMLTDNAELIEIGIVYVVIMGTIQIPMNVSKIYNGILRSGGCKTTPLKIQMAMMWGFRIPVVIFCASVLHLPLYSVWIVIALDQIMKWALCKHRANHKVIVQ